MRALFSTAVGTADIGLTDGQYVERNSKPIKGEICDRCELMVLENDCTPSATIHFVKSS